MVSYVLDEERDSLYNMPENLQASEGYERMEESVDSLEEVVGYIDEAMRGIDNAM